VLVAILLVGSGVAAAIQLSLASTSADPMGASNPAPQGGQALARVLAEHGVDVRKASSLVDARRAAADRDDTTVLLSDPKGILDARQLGSVLSLGSDVVAVDPGFVQLRAAAPTVTQAGERTVSSASPGCRLAAADRAGSVAGRTHTFRVAEPATGCFRASDGTFAVAQSVAAGTRVTVVGSGLLDNDGVARAGNAALAIGLLGQHRTLVWYLPSRADAAAAGAPSLAELTPAWVTPAILLLIAVVVAAGVWRGRRFGPLVVENLPVVVRAGETIEGRARLYRTASARGHALDALRVGAVQRIGVLCGLPPRADVDQVAASAAALTGRAVKDVRDVLLDGVPLTDASAVAFAARLAELEDAVRSAVRRAP
jgi:hypothetical protein